MTNQKAKQFETEDKFRIDALAKGKSNRDAAIAGMAGFMFSEMRKGKR